MSRMDGEASRHDETAGRSELEVPGSLDVPEPAEPPDPAIRIHHELEQTRARLRRALGETAALTLALETAETEAATFRRREREFEEARLAYYALDAMEHSLSWRITRPLRRLSGVVGRIRRGGA
jgi:hypothetical protein